jgi:hypothetical protein
MKDYGILDRFFLTLKDTLNTSNYDSYAKALLVLQAKAQTDTEVAKIVDYWK